MSAASPRARRAVEKAISILREPDDTPPRRGPRRAGLSVPHAAARVKGAPLSLRVPRNSLADARSP